MSLDTKYYDLHLHTTYSDGTFSVKELLERAKKNGMSGISITDHDTMDGIEEGIEESKKIGVDFIPGIEFSCSLEGLEIHILGYFLDIHCEKLKIKLEKLKEARDERNIKIVKKLNDRGLKITLEDIKKEAVGNIVSRAHICNAMMNKGYVYSKGEAFKQYLGRTGSAYVEKRDSNPIEIIKLIKECGGISSLAHPIFICESREKIEKLLEKLIDAGLDGIETNYSSYTSKEKKYFSKLADKYNLLKTGGSDFHGENRIGVDIGKAYICGEDVEKFMSRK